MTVTIIITIAVLKVSKTFALGISSSKHSHFKLPCYITRFLSGARLGYSNSGFRMNVTDHIIFCRARNFVHNATNSTPETETTPGSLESARNVGTDRERYTSNKTHRSSMGFSELLGGRVAKTDE